MSRGTFFQHSLRAGVLVCVAGGLAANGAAQSVVRPATDQPAAQQSAADKSAATTQTVNATVQAGAQAAQDVPVQPAKKVKMKKSERVVQTKASRKADEKEKKSNLLLGKDVSLPDKELYDKARNAIKSGHFDIARLDLQTLLNTYPESTYQMRAKLAVADSWYEQGGSAALDQAEAEYKDFITFFPNVPEAALAQMRVGDIYFRQMDKPDRDGAAKALSAQTEYRLMIQQYPDSQFIPEAKQRLREVQQVLAAADMEKAQFYAERQVWAAAIARYQTVVDTYPQYSDVDQALIALGDCYMEQARAVRAYVGLPEDQKVELLRHYEDLAAKSYGRVVLEHNAAPHMEDAKDKLADMSRPIPVPTPEQLAASQALESSRAQYTISNRMALLILRKPDVVEAARIGDPSLTDPKPTLAPDVLKENANVFNAARSGKPIDEDAAPAPAVAATPEAASATAAAVPASTAPLAFGDIPVAGANGNAGPTITNVNPDTSAPAPRSGTGLGVEIVQPSSAAGTTPAATTPVTTGAPAAVKNNGDLHPLPPASNTAALPPVEQPTEAPQQENDVKPGDAQAKAATTTTNKGKTKTAAADTKDESTSKKKPKTGLGKLNPF